jgi:hypothetical protein
LRLSGLSRAFRPGGGEFPSEALDAESSGIADVAIIGKYQLWKSAPGGGGPSSSGLAALVSVRIPTGEEENLRGLGVTRTQMSLGGSAAYGRISPHVNVGYELWSAGIDIPSNFLEDSTVTAKDQVLYSGGVEIEVNPLLTANVDVLGRYIRGAGRIEPQEFRYDPNSNEFGILGATVLVATGGLNSLTLAPGVKWNLWKGALLSAHALIAIAGEGLQDRIAPVIGFDWAFALPAVRP